MDGGGMKGLGMVQMLRALEARVGQPLHNVFDILVGSVRVCFTFVFVFLFCQYCDLVRQ